jgi:hypothetical protein
LYQSEARTNQQESVVNQTEHAINQVTPKANTIKCRAMVQESSIQKTARFVHKRRLLPPNKKAGR